MVVNIVRGLVLAILVIAAASYIGDWAVYKMRGAPHATIQVNYLVSAPLKNDKQEIDYLGSENVLCSVTLFPQDGHAPCWYLRRHTNQVKNY